MAHHRFPGQMRPQMAMHHPGMHPGQRAPMMTPVPGQMVGPGQMTNPGMMMQGHQQSPMGMPGHMIGHQSPRIPPEQYMMQHGPPMGHHPMAGPQQMSPHPVTAQMTTSPAMVQQQSPVSMNQLVPSPAMMAASSPQQQQQQQQPQYQMLSSPAQRMTMDQPGQLNTPGNPQSAEDQAYLDKLKQLSRYIEPLRRMISQTEKVDERKKEHVKISKLLDVLLNSNTRVPMSALLKCEQVLEKMDFEVKTRAPEQHMCMPLFDAISAHSKSPVLNHTLFRTVGPPLLTIHGPPMCAHVSRNRKRKSTVDDDSDEEPEIPDVLQGEVARLERKFRVTLDPAFQTKSKTVHVVCKLEDKTLPTVPPIMVTIPSDYPSSSPNCHTHNENYGCTPFLRSVEKVLRQRLDRLPDQYSLTSLLSTWELSIRQVCAA